MRTETIERTLYQFGELTDDAKQHAIEKLWNLNVDHDWWEFTYETIQKAGECLGIDCTIDGFDLDRGSHVALSGSYTYRKGWRAALPLEMDEFVEAIPFRETKGYVQGVIRNSAQYRPRIGRSSYLRATSSTSTSECSIRNTFALKLATICFPCCVSSK